MGVEDDPFESEGDPRVLFVLNVILSFVFSYLVVWGLDFLGAVDFSLLNLALATVLLVVATHYTIMR